MNAYESAVWRVIPPCIRNNLLGHGKSQDDIIAEIRRWKEWASTLDNEEIKKAYLKWLNYWEKEAEKRKEGDRSFMVTIHRCQLVMLGINCFALGVSVGFWIMALILQ